MAENFASKTAYLDNVEKQWENYFKEQGYVQEPGAKITSKIDTSVALIGSTTSPLKWYLMNDEIGKKGRFLIQDCMRTQGLKNIKNSEPSMYGTYFRCMGVMNEYSTEHLDKTVFNAFDYLQNRLGIPADDIRIRISSQDKDLLSSIGQVDKDIVREIDTFPEQYYRHKYGDNVNGILGRNFNVGIRNKGTDTFADIGNCIIMEQGNKKSAIEMGFGNQTISRARFGVDSTMKSSRMADVINIDSVEKTKMADAMISTAVLQSEGIASEAQHSQYFKRLLRQYYGSAINHWKEKLQMSDEQVLDYLESFIALEQKNTNFKAKNTWTTEK